MINRPNHSSRACRGSTGLLLSFLLIWMSQTHLCSSFTLSTRNPRQSGVEKVRLGHIGQVSNARQRLIIRWDVAETASNDLKITNASAAMDTANPDDEDDDEYEYVEFDNLTEQEFIGSEWLVGTNWDRSPNRIDETWARLIVDADGKNVVVWGDESKGTWTLDVATQFLSLSKENVFTGKQIWACTVSDYYYLQGTVRGWNYWSAAAVIGQWQAKRLGVDRDEAGTPPWFEDANDAESQ